MDWDNQRPSAPSTPSSMSSQSTVNANTGPRNEKIPTLKQISPSPSVSALSKLNDDDLRRKGLEDLLRILRRVEGDYKSLMAEHGNVVKDVNRRFQIFVLETRSLKDVNQKLQDDNQELRDLCCFLDDDRQRGRKLAREWQRFGRYTASVMRSEVAVYQEKLRELEERQGELVTENMELKELCLYLDQERVRMTGDRDEGDGSSNGTVTGHEDGIVAMDTTGSVTPTPSVTHMNNFSLTQSSTVSYIKELELKVHRLEEEKKSLAQRIERNNAEGVDGGLRGNDVSAADDISGLNPDQSVHAPLSPSNRRSSMSGKPEAVVHAMKVLQVHEELEKLPVEEENLDDHEKAIVREMCNVVWRKLGDVGDVGSFNESSDSLLDPPYVPDSPIKPNSSMMSAVGGAAGHGQAHSHSVSQPQPQMASTPLASVGKMGHPEAAAAPPQAQPMDSEHFHNMQHRPDRQQQPQQQHHPFRTPHEIGHGQPAAPAQQQPIPSQGYPPPRGREPPPPPQATSVPHSYVQHRHGDRDPPDLRSRQDSVAERDRYIAENERNFKYSSENPHKWREEDRRNPDHHKYTPYYPGDGGKPGQQQPQFSGHPPASQMHSQQQSRPHQDVAAYPHYTDRAMDLGPRDPNPPPHHQQDRQPPPPVMPRAHDQQRHLSSSQGYTNHGGPPGKHSDMSIPGPGRFPQHPPQQGRNPQPHGHQPVRLLDAPGVHRHNPPPTSDSGPGPQVPVQMQRKEDFAPPSQPRPRSRGENRYEDRHSAERDPKPNHPTSRSLSASSAPGPHPSGGPAPQGQSMSSGPPHPPAGQGIAGFRAYPPPQSKPAPPMSSWRGAPAQDMRAPPGGGGGYPPGPTPRPNYSNPPVQQGRANNPTKRFQEQEWRQTYLDDSDTL